MALYNLNKATAIYPWEQDQVNSLTKKWKISDNELSEAILQTGSINKEVIRNYLVQKGAMFSPEKWWRFLRILYFRKRNAKNVA